MLTEREGGLTTMLSDRLVGAWKHGAGPSSPITGTKPPGWMDGWMDGLVGGWVGGEGGGGFLRTHWASVSATNNRSSALMRTDQLASHGLEAMRRLWQGR